ncbi:unnamed protein product [Rotaria magnacalcarata]|uniref:Uncharacterized protein n=2 Tax=Rotaria magnacalcarata TaxID=392030 RepID=A0A814VES1_9BILA|nr:unnamed protein product [Rotaria magnacalcarata]
MALAFKTGGQYIPLANAGNLSSIIVGSAQEEISLEKIIAQVHEEVMREATLRGGSVDETELTRRIREIMHDGDLNLHRKTFHNLILFCSKTKPTKRKLSTQMKSIAKQNPRQESVRGYRQSARLVFNKQDEKRSTENETMDVS